MVESEYCQKLYSKRARAKFGLTIRPTSRVETQVGSSDPIILCGKVIDQRTKGTPGITGLYHQSVHSEDVVWHLDVGSSDPEAERGFKGSAVRRLNWYVS